MITPTWAVFPLAPEYEWFWVMCQFIAVTCTLVFIVRQIKIQNDSHLVTSFASFEERWNSQMMLKARKQVCFGYKPDNVAVDATTHHVGLFFEELGVYCSKGVLNRDIVWEIYSFEIEHYWLMTRNAIYSFRKKQNDNTFYYNFERLHQHMKNIGVKKKAPMHERTQDDIQRFIEHELERVHFFGDGPEMINEIPKLKMDTPRR